MTECVQHVCQASRTPRLLLFQLHLIAAAICRLTGVHRVCATAKHSSTSRYNGKVLVFEFGGIIHQRPSNDNE